MPVKKTSLPKKVEEPATFQPIKTYTPPLARPSFTQEKPRRKNKLLFFLFLIIIIAIIIVCFNLVAKKNNQPAAPEEDLLTKVSRHIVLPSSEQPFIATIENIDNLVKAQKFYEGAKNGDKLLIYRDRAIIYDPARDVLVNVGPIYVSDDQKTSGGSGEETAATPEEKALTLEIRNGSGVAGAASKLSTDLKDTYNVIKTGNAASSDYAKTLIVNLAKKDTADLLSKVLGEIVFELPAGESSSTADIVIIIGKN
jgi:hypothetical protein